MATGLYSPVNLAQHASSAENIANIIKQGFIPSGASSPGFQIADIFQPGKKVFTSTSPNLLSQYGDDVVDVISSAKNLRLPSGGIDFTKGTIGFGDEIVSRVDQANKGMELARKLRAGQFANSALARRLLETGTNVNPNLIRTGIFNNPFFRRALQFGSKGLGIFSLFVPSRELGSGEITPEIIEQEVRARNAAEAQESRNQSRDDYTGGGGPVVIGKGGGEKKTVSPRSREAMYGFSDGGLAELEGDTRQLFPVGGDEQLGIRPQNDDTTSLFLVRNAGGSSLLAADSSNSVVKVNSGQDIANTQYAYFGVNYQDFSAISANTHYAIPFSASGGTNLTNDVDFGTGTDPDTSFTTANTDTQYASQIVPMMWYVQDNIAIDAITSIEGGDNAAGDTTRMHLLSYTFNSGSSSALASGTVLAYNSDVTNGGSEQAYKSTWTVSSGNVDAGKVILAFFRADSDNSDYSLHITIKYHLR